VRDRRQLTDPTLVADVDNALRASQLKPSRLTLELTESRVISAA